MIKQTLMFTTPASLSLKNNQLVISRMGSDEVVTRPIEDIGFVVVEDQRVALTIPLLNALTENNVSVIFCDEKHMPNSMLMPLEANTTLQESYRYQVDAGEVVKKRMWKQIVEAKIRNQSALLNSLGLDGDELKPYYMNVKSGDGDNREGAAARIYWNILFEKSFRRSRDGSQPNSMLNYGYAILRAAMARAIVGSGLYPAFGIFHRNRYNAFPLADDLMEPYRPFVDEIVYHLFVEGAVEELTKETKSELLRVLFADVKIGKMVKPLEVALSSTTASLVRVYSGKENSLNLPAMP